MFSYLGHVIETPNKKESLGISQQSLLVSSLLIYIRK